MPEERFEEKTEPATPRKREEARQEGNVSRSADLSSAVLLVAAVGFLMAFGPSFIAQFGKLMAHLLENLHGFDPAPDAMSGELRRLIAILGMLMAPFLLAMIAAALAVNLVQVGFLFTTRVFEPNPDKLNPITGLRRIFSLRGLIRSVFGILKLTVVLVVVGLSLWAERAALIGLGEAEFETVAATWGSTSLTIAMRAAVALLILALLDFAYQRWQYGRDLRMSKQEVKEEMKRYEGDPKIRERRRAIQRQAALQRMLGKVPTATVVITNPTHLAVALRYQQGETPAPLCVAKGAGPLAERIIDLAREHGVAIVRRPEVARPLYQAVEVGQYIPEELYKAVAEVLAYVYRLKGMAGKVAA
jgi:flagellar biosynthetic protein FlhB